jgi:hypothetical protein
MRRATAFAAASPGIGCLPQQRQFAAEFVEQAGEAPGRGVVGRAYVAAPRLDDQVDRTVLQMKPPAVGQQPDLRNPHHERSRADGGEVT